MAPPRPIRSRRGIGQFTQGASLSQPSTPPPPPPADDLQFDRVEPAAQPGTDTAPMPTVCAACKNPIQDVYFTAGEVVICPACRDGVVNNVFPGNPFTRFLRAAALGIGGGIVGAVIWYAVQRLTGYQIGLIAIVVGLLVGIGVRNGSYRRGGIGYQLLAVFITYLAICSTYVPDLMELANKEAVDNTPLMTVITYAVVFVFSLAVPFFDAPKNIIGILIIGFALWEAWKINRRPNIQLSGPFSLAPPPPLPSIPPPAPMA
jgi:hypothetical protein